MKNLLPALNDSSLSDESSNVYGCHDKPWHHAVDDNPDSVTYHILCMSLKHRPPFSVVKYMLSLNPKAADIPKQGPSALQVAVQYKCNLDVIHLLILTCPVALVATNPDTSLDPLAYTKRYHPSDLELIELLSRPISHWMNSGNYNGAGDSALSCMSSPPSKQANAVPAIVELTAKPRHCHSSVSDKSARSTIDRQELNNVKALCASLVKGQKRLNKELEMLHNKRSPPPMDDALCRLKKRSEELALDQLKALDIKEQAMLTHIKWMEQRFSKSVAVGREEDREMQFKVNGKLDEMMCFIETEMRVLQGRLSCIEHDMAQTVEKLDNLWAYHGSEDPFRGSIERFLIRPRPVTPTPSPVIFCSRPNKIYDEMEDDVRSLLSEDEIVSRSRQLFRASNQISPLTRMVTMFKEGFFL